MDFHLSNCTSFILAYSFILAPFIAVLKPFSCWSLATPCVYGPVCMKVIVVWAYSVAYMTCVLVMGETFKPSTSSVQRGLHDMCVSAGETFKPSTSSVQHGYHDMCVSAGENL